MKKIGILTFPNSPSFGASLQMFALYSTVRRLGNDVEIINYMNRFMKAGKHISSEKGIQGKIKKSLVHILDSHGRSGFQQFEAQLEKYPENELSESSQLRKIADRYDYMICGSDQVWNPRVTGGDMSYFFDFCMDDRKKISYAPSFGLEEIPEEMQCAYAKEISKFNALSVREANGVQIVKELTGRDAELVIDPTMLLKQEDWKNQAVKFDAIPERYIARFIFNKDASVENFIDQLCWETGLPVITIGGIICKPGFTGPIGPPDWLYVIENADYVVTDSFHGAVFSILFEKKLYISSASSTKSRLITLADTFGLANRVIQNNCISDNIDYEKVNAILENRREESLAFLKNAII